MKCLVAIWALLACGASAAAPTDVEVARRALGDGLWSVAAKHAAAAADAAKSPAAREAARLVELEALAAGGRAADVLSRLDAWSDASDESFRYWRAWALAETGRGAEALKRLAEPFKTPDLAGLALRLGARVSVAVGDRKAAAELFGKASAAYASNVAVRVENALEWARALDGYGAAGEALGVLRKEGAVEAAGAGGDEARLLAAELLDRTGDVAAGREMRGRLVAGGTNTSERAFVLASCGLSGGLLAIGATNDAIRVASNAVARAEHPDLACQAGLTLGFGLFSVPEHRAAGHDLVAQTVRRFPENPACGSAQLRLADGLLEVGDAEGAVREYDVLRQSFPKYALDAHVLEGRGWALLRLGRRAEAVGLFVRAAQVSTNAADKARCVFKQAEALATDGRHEEAAAVYGAVGAGEFRELARFRRADSLYRARQTEAALKEFRALFDEGGGLAVEAGLGAATVEASLERAEKAIEDFGRVLDAKGGAKPTDEQRARAFEGRGRAFYRACRFREAQSDFDSVAGLLPARKSEMAFLVALCLYGDGREKEAMAVARRLLETVDDERLKGDLLFWLAKCDAGRREWMAAIEGFEACSVQTGVSEMRRVESLVRAARCARLLPDFKKVVELTGLVATNVASVEAEAPARKETPYVAEALVLQGEALIELARFDEAVLVLERVGRLKAPEELLRRAAVSRADCLFAMGADDANRYRSALDAYRAVLREDVLSDSMRLAVAFKIGRTLEKLRRVEEAIDFYYQNVVLIYYWEAVRPESFETARRHWFDANARDLFARATLIIADYYEARGEYRASAQVLGYLVAAGMPASKPAARRVRRLKEKGGFQ